MIIEKYLNIIEHITIVDYFNNHELIAKKNLVLSRILNYIVKNYSIDYILSLHYYFNSSYMKQNYETLLRQLLILFFKRKKIEITNKILKYFNNQKYTLLFYFIIDEIKYFIIKDYKEFKHHFDLCNYIQEYFSISYKDRISISYYICKFLKKKSDFKYDKLHYWLFYKLALFISKKFNITGCTITWQLLSKL